MKSARKDGWEIVLYVEGDDIRIPAPLFHSREPNVATLLDARAVLHKVFNHI